MNAGVMLVTGHYYAFTHESLRLASMAFSALLPNLLISSRKYEALSIGGVLTCHCLYKSVDLSHIFL